MGMVIALHRVSQQNLDRVASHPPYSARILYPNAPDCWPSDNPPSSRPSSGWLARLLRRTQPVATEPTPLPQPPEFVDGELQTLEMDKIWHGVHFLLTGSEQPAPLPAGFIMGGAELDPPYLEYGRIISAEEARAVSELLQSLSNTELQNRDNPEHMNNLGVYGKPWSPDPNLEEDLAYLISTIDELRPFLADAATRGEGLLITLG